MVKSMYAAVAGLKTHQSKMDVIGNNIANVNTYGYKKERASFADTYYNTSQSASEATSTKGGQNPSQVGYGVKMGSVDTIVTTGGSAITDNPTDVMINGAGYFMVGGYNTAGYTTSSQADGNSETGLLGLKSLYFTRVGIFNFDGQGNLVDSSSYYVQGYASARGAQGLYAANVVDGGATKGYYYRAASDADNGAAGYMVKPVKASDGTIISYDVYKVVAAAAPTITAATDTTPATTEIADTVLIDDNKIMTLNPDEYVGGALSLYVLRQGTEYSNLKAYNVSQDTGYVKSIATGMVVSTSDVLSAIQMPRTYTLNGYYDKDGVPLEVTLYGENDSVQVTAYKIDAGTGKPVLAGADATTGNPDANSTLTVKGSEYWNFATAVQLSSISVGGDGTVSGVDARNRVMTLGKIAVANVPNAMALENQGDNYYMAKANTGVVTAEVPGEGATGSLSSGTLEMSNVDLSTEFTDMITTQRGYQANSRIITVTDSMLEELVNLKRS